MKKKSSQRKTAKQHSKSKMQLQLTEFKEGQNPAMYLKDLELAKHEKNKSGVITIARQIAASIAEKKGEVSVDDIRATLPDDILNDYDKRWFGAIFKDKRFRFLRKGNSQVAANHGNIMNIYTLTINR